jgi:integrase
MRCWVLLCSDLALRNATASSICPENYNAEQGCITFRTKFGTWQTLPVTQELKTIFNSCRTNQPTNTPYIVLLHPLGRICKTWPGQNFTLMARRAGITRKLTPHDLRRTTAKNIFDQTHDVRIVQAVLGHKQLATTLYYLDHRNTPVPVALLELAKLNPITERTQ